MTPKRFAIWILSALVAATAHCAAHESIDHGLVTFNATTDINDSKELNVVVSESRGQEETLMRRPSGVTHAVSVMKRPTTTTTAMDVKTGAELTITKAAANETLMESSVRTSPTLVVSVATKAPVTVSIPTQTLGTSSVSPEIPAEVLALTDIAMMNSTTALGQDPGQVDMLIPTIQSSYGLSNSSLINVKTDAPTAEWTSTGAAIIAPEEATILPPIAPAARAVELGSTNSPPDNRSAGKTDESTTVPISFDSSGSNDIVTISSASGSKGADGRTIPGQVHARSSADVSLNGSSKIADTDSLDSFRFQHAKMKKRASSSSGNYGEDCSTNSSKNGSRENPTSDTTRTSNDGNGGFAQGFLNPGGVTVINSSSASFYSLGTGSIFAIVGVIAGIMGLLLLFGVISRKTYTTEDDESPLPYGYNMEIRSVTRFSPTFMEDDSFVESDYNGTALMVAVPSYQYDGVSFVSRESSDEVPSLRGHMIAPGDTSAWSRASSMHSFNKDVDTGMSAGSSITSDSEISGSWSSVLASDTERYTLRNTRDTSLGSWSATNWSPFESTTSPASGMYGMTRPSFADFRQTSGSDSSRSSPRLINHLGPVEFNHSIDSTEV